MKYRVYTESDIIEKSRELIHAFMHRELISFTELLDEQFVWLGDYSSQYISGKDNFIKTIKEELLMPPLELSQEEYSILTHERHTWVSYGRCVVTTQIGDDSFLTSGIHFTFVWKQDKDNMLILMASANHVQDEQQQDPDALSIPQARVFDRVDPKMILRKDSKKLRLRDRTGNQHFLYPDEIIYVQSKDKYCTVYTATKEICDYRTIKSLEQPGFLRIHSRYLVNISYIASIRRYEVNLIDGRTLPIGKNRYMDIQKQLAATIPY